jgi:hypothetical protein
MTAECEILIEHLKDVLTIPVAAVVEQRGSYFAWIKTPTGTERRPLVLGATNDQFVEVKDGLVENDLVVLNPRAVVAEARAVKEAEEDVKVDEKFGGERKAPANAKKMPGGPGAGGPAAGGPGAGGPGAGGPGGPGGGGGRPSFSMSQLDKDGDGKIAKEELPEQAQGFFDAMDTNTDGFVDAQELAAVRRRMGGGGGEGGPGGPGGGGPPGGGGGQ